MSGANAVAGIAPDILTADVVLDGAQAAVDTNPVKGAKCRVAILILCSRRADMMIHFDRSQAVEARFIGTIRPVLILLI